MTDRDTDNDSDPGSDSESESEYEYDSEEDDIYHTDEHSLTRYTIVICELYNDKIHGKPNPLNNSGVEYNYLVINRFKTLNIKFINYVCNCYLNLNLNNHIATEHNIFRNYGNIIQRPDYIKPEIAECLYLSGGECVAILKTYWIRIIQRVWKRIYRDRERICRERCSFKALKHREFYGRWPSTCLYFPSLKGMLSSLHS